MMLYVAGQAFCLTFLHKNFVLQQNDRVCDLVHYDDNGYQLE
jgi:hypothetical protein